ncbi:MAG: hypothetical protein ACXVW6_01680 [Nocardioidaceae bacterium]
MTHHPDDPHRDPAHEHVHGEAEGADAPEPALDEDAAWRLIVDNYGERPTMGPVDEPPAPTSRSVFDRSFLEASAPPSADDPGAGWEDEGHFVPPEPPPLPRLGQMDPRRLLAWAGLLCGPALLLLAVVAGLGYPSWFSGFLVAGFVGGFTYLVATMPRGRRDDWSGDDGAVV